MQGILGNQEMDGKMKNLIPQQTQQYFNQIYSDLSRDQLKVLNDILDEIFLKIGFVPDIANSNKIVNKVQTIFREKTAKLSKYDQVVLKQSLVAKLALNLPTIVENMNLPKSILSLYHDAFSRVADKLKNSLDVQNNLTLRISNLHFLLGFYVPCGTYVVDMSFKINFRGVIYTVLRSKKLGAFIRYIQAKGAGRWLKTHVDMNYLDEFNEKGRDECFLRIAELLERRNDIRGMVGTSWYFDPQLEKISPHLTYLRQLPLERGAFLLRHRTEQLDIENAIKKSKTRRRLYQEKKYIPQLYSIIWPRKDLIRWAEQARRIK